MKWILSFRKSLMVQVGQDERVKICPRIIVAHRYRQLKAVIHTV